MVELVLKMQNCVKYLPRKSFNTYGVVLLTLFGLFAVVVISISSSFAFDTSFHCYSKTKDPSFTKFINAKCSLEYEEKFHFTLPMHVMFILNFGIVITLSIIYAYWMKHRVEKFHYSVGTASSNDDDGENQVMLAFPSPGQTSRVVHDCLLGYFSTFPIYIAYLVVARIIPLLLFASAFYTAHIPNNFPCPWQHKMQGKSTSNLNDTLKSQYNLMIVDCTNAIGGKSKTLVDAVATVDVFVVILTFLELGYIAWLAFNDRNFMTEQEFCTVYLLRKRKSIRKLVRKIRERFNHGDEFQLKDDFGTQIFMRPLEDIYKRN